jgi:DNA-binding transcriptional LysR family regulator
MSLKCCSVSQSRGAARLNALFNPIEDNAGMTERRNVLTPEALAMMDTIARTGSFAAAARELGKVPSALTYNVRQLEDALDVLLFDRSSRQAQLTAAGTELLHEGRRLLQEMDAVANRVQRVAGGWEATLSISVDDIIDTSTLMELVEAFCGLCHGEELGQRHATRLRLRTDVMSGTWEALVTGQVDLAIGVPGTSANPGNIEIQPLGKLPFVFCVAPHHPLAKTTGPIEPDQLVRNRAIAVADTAQRLTPMTVNMLPGQDVLTVPSTQLKLKGLLRGLGCGYLPEPLARPHLLAGHLVAPQTTAESPSASLHYAWRAERGPLGLGKALKWWLEQLEGPATRRALLDRGAAKTASTA